MLFTFDGKICPSFLFIDVVAIHPETVLLIAAPRDAIDHHQTTNGATSPTIDAGLESIAMDLRVFGHMAHS